MDKVNISYIKTEMLDIEQINEYQGNLKELSKINYDKLWLSIQENGFSEPFVVWENKGKINCLNGHQRIRLLKKKREDGIEIPKLPCNFVSCKSKRDAKRLILALTSQYGRITEEGLYEFSINNKFDADFLKERFELPWIDLNQFTIGYMQEDENDNGVGDNIPEIDESNIICKEGDLWQLGNHRLLCADCTIKDNVDRLLDGNKIDIVFSDPPYGVSYADKNKFLNTISRGNRIQKEIAQDHCSEKEIQEFWKKIFIIIRENLAEYNSYYITGPQIQGMMMMMMMMMMQEAGLPYRHVIIWVKNNHVLGRCDYNYKHEPIFFGWTTKHKFYGNGTMKTSVWEIDKPLKSDLHPTMKPIELIINALLNSSEKNMLCFDPFLGSGSTLIACEKTGRNCYGLEIDPYYCSIIIQRYIDYVEFNDNVFLLDVDGKKKIPYNDVVKYRLKPIKKED